MRFRIAGGTGPALPALVLMVGCIFLVNVPDIRAQELYSPYPAIFEANQKAVLSAERSGVLTQLNCDVGDTVKKGAVIGRLDTAELGLKKKRAETALKHLNVQVSELTSLKKRGLATNEDVARAVMERDVTKTDVDLIKRQIADSLIVAPFNGVIVRRNAQPHEWVTAGQPVVDMVNLDNIRAIANIPANIAVNLKPEAVHAFFVSDLNAEVEGTVLTVAPEVDERSNTVQVIWTMKKGDRQLLPGMKGEVRIAQ